MRVIGGTARGVALAAPKGTITRPTSDRAREGLFNIIARRVRGAVFLDLYAGSGAIGIEALSRGAGFAVFADSAKEAIECVRENLQKARLSEKALVLNLSADNAIKRLSADSRVFDIVFADPPYGQSLCVETYKKIMDNRMIKQNGIYICETSKGEDFEREAGIVCEKTARYGIAKIWLKEQL